MKKIIIICLFSFHSIFSNIVLADNSSARINGVTDFLIERANETYFYMFENKMRNNEKFACYFPTTYEYIKDGDLKALMKTKNIWKESLGSDFSILSIRAVSHGIKESVDFNKAAMRATDEYAEILRYLKIKIDGKEQSLSFIPIGATKNTKDLINGFYDVFNAVRDGLIGFNKKLIDYSDVCSEDRPVKDDLINEISALKGTYANLDKWVAHIDRHKSKIIIDIDAINADCKIDSTSSVCGIKDLVFEEMVPKLKAAFEKPVVKAVAGVVILNKYINDIKDRDTSTGKVVEAFKVIKDKKLEDSQTLKKLKHYLLFIAEVADSEEPGQVQDLLKEYTLPVTSFIEKREPGNKSFMISSYFGYGAGDVLNDDVSSDNASGFYIPVGLEYSMGLRNKSSVSFMLSPVDFGYPVSLKLNGVVEDLELEDIIAPSFSVAYGIRDYPINVGVAFQKGRFISPQDKEEKRVMIFVAFDMPLLAF